MGVETFYGELKNKLKVEHFSGYSNNTIQQDFCLKTRKIVISQGQPWPNKQYNAGRTEKTGYISKKNKPGNNEKLRNHHMHRKLTH